MRSVLVAFAVVLSSCSGSLLGGAPPTPETTTPGTSSPLASQTPRASPTLLPASVVRMSVNGIDYPVTTALRATGGDGPLTIVLTFPFAVNRESVERWGLPGSPTQTWLDDRTLRLVFQVTEPSLVFKAPYTQSANGDAVIDFFVVDVTFPAPRTVSVFTVAEVAAAAAAQRFPQASSTWRVRVEDAMTLSSDAKRVLVYDALGPLSGPAPTLIELDTNKAAVLAQPPASDGWLAFADWMADGRLVVVGRGVWVGDVNGNNMKRIADTQSAVTGAVWLALTDPGERRLALWAYNTDGHIAIVDLDTGAVQRLAGPFRRCAADGRPSFAWSGDGGLLAGTDCDGEEGPAKARVRIVDVAADRTVRTIEGGVYSINGLPTGNFVLVRDSGEGGAGSRLLGLIVGFDGQERSRYLGHAWLMSPDRRYLLQTRFQPAGGPDYTLFDLVTGTSVQFALPCAYRDAGGCPSPRWLRDGRLAFY